MRTDFRRREAKRVGAVATVKAEELTQHVVTDAVGRVLSQVVAVKEVERAKGFEPSTFTLAR